LPMLGNVRSLQSAMQQLHQVDDCKLTMSH
jgi:hypothetical protein